MRHRMVRAVSARVGLLLLTALVGAAGCGGESDKPAAHVTTPHGPPEVWIVSFPPDRKILAVKVVREVTGLGLKASKDLVEAAPRLVKVAADLTEAEALAKKLREVGVTTEVRVGGQPTPQPRPPAERALTEVDVEHYVAIVAESKKGASHDTLHAFILARGLTVAEWYLVQARIASALLAMRVGGEAVTAQRNQADIDFVTLHRARLEPTLDVEAR